MVRVKMLYKGVKAADGAPPVVFEHNGCRFIYDAACREYDWLVVYDEMPRKVGSVSGEAEPLACPRERTILVTAEPPSIKLYPACYTRQFGYVLTTHTPEQLPHPNHLYGEGCLLWCAGYTREEAFSMPEFEKTEGLSIVCSAKQQTHTLHNSRYQLVKYLSEHLPQMDWYGYGVRELKKKCDVLSPYRYHIGIENYVAPYHWTDKISDPILGLCLTFYHGDPRLEEVFPAESFIRIPIDDPPEACRIIREAMENGEYEKRLPAIREARCRLLERYNIFSRVAALIAEKAQEPAAAMPARPVLLKGRHRLRRNPLNMIAEGLLLLRVKLGLIRI